MAAHLMVCKLMDHCTENPISGAAPIPILGDQWVNEAAREGEPDRNATVLGVCRNTDGFIEQFFIPHDASHFIT